MQKRNKKIILWGYGNMGRAIANAIKKHDKNAKIEAYDIDKKAVRITGADFLVLAVKPQDAKTAITEIKEAGLSKNTILVSIMAGVPIKRIATLSGHKKIVRMMPNLGLAMGRGIAVWKAEGLSASELKAAKSFMDSFTQNFEVRNEDMIDRSTAVSGSGVAYFFLLAKAMEDGAVRLGFKKSEARSLIENTFISSALLSPENEYADLITRVKSKGGTTEAALKTFQKEKFNAIVEKAMRSAYKRARELAK